MNIRASGRSALIIAAGLWLGFAGPLHATDSAGDSASQAVQAEPAGKPVKLSKFSKHRSRHVAHVAHPRHSAKTASKAAAKSDKTAAVSVPQDSDKQSPLPPTVANANALMPVAADTPVTDKPKTEADALASSAGQTLAASQTNPAPQPQAGTVPAAPPVSDPAAAATADVVPPDELNDVDRALTENQQATPGPVARAAPPALALASIDSPASTTNAGTTTGQSATTDDSAWNQTSLIGKIFIAFGGLLTLASAARMFIA